MRKLSADAQKLVWECDKGHLFLNTWDSSKASCPVCTQEQKALDELDDILNRLGNIGKQAAVAFRGKIKQLSKR